MTTFLITVVKRQLPLSLEMIPAWSTVPGALEKRAGLNLAKRKERGHTYHFLPFPLHRGRKFYHLLLRNPYYLTIPSNRLPGHKHDSSKMGLCCNQCNKLPRTQTVNSGASTKRDLIFIMSLWLKTNKTTQQNNEGDSKQDISVKVQPGL